MIWSQTLSGSTHGTFALPPNLSAMYSAYLLEGPNPGTVEKNASHLAIKREFQKKTTTQLRDFVFAYPMEIEQ
ncbi:uncharacterized protein DS421_3g102680 [Arachis hypogaea]|nr:uncharacterized protein DS421_3g102680 [Arachis hypogaea]